MNAESGERIRQLSEEILLHVPEAGLNTCAN